MAHMLKCTIYSFLVIPPFPTSSISGSVPDITKRRINIYTKGKQFLADEDYQYLTALTIPTTRPSKLSINFIHVCSGHHAAKEETNNLQGFDQSLKITVFNL